MGVDRQTDLVCQKTMEHRKDSAPCCPRRHHITYTFVLHQPKSLCVCVCLSHTHRYTHTQTSPIFIAQSEKNAGNGWKFTTLWKEGQVERTPTHAYTQPPNTTQTHKHKNKYSYRVIYLYQHLQFKRMISLKVFLFMSVHSWGSKINKILKCIFFT